REVEDHVRPTRHQPAARILARNIERVGIDLAGKSRRMVRRGYIDQRELVDRLTVEPNVGDEPRCELAPDHAGRAGDENVHALIPFRELGATLSPCGRGASGASRVRGLSLGARDPSPASFALRAWKPPSPTRGGVHRVRGESY